MSRVCVIPFSKPSIAPESEDQEEAFEIVDELIDNQQLSQAVGWIISLSEAVNSKQQLKEMKEKLRDSFKGRCLMNWSLVALTTTKVNLFS